MHTDIYRLQQGTTPLLISFPHVGTAIAADQQHRYTDRARQVEDTDWHLEQLYGFARDMGAGMLVPSHSRYVIDLNRPPQNTPMYAGANNTELCPTRFFSGDPIYKEGLAPDDAEIARRRETYWHPYHSALQTELARLKEKFGYAILFDAHSINSVLPWLFEGQLPDLNLGTVTGASCSSALRSRLAAVLAEQNQFTQVVDGRFKGGYITRHYGAPEHGIHAVQLEMAYRCYMEEKAPFTLDDERAGKVVPVLKSLISAMMEWDGRA